MQEQEVKMNAEVEQTETDFQQKLKTQGKLSASDLQRMLDIHAQQMHEYERTFVAVSFERKNGLNFMLNFWSGWCYWHYL